jgi:hypothetical protein
MGSAAGGADWETIRMVAGPDMCWISFPTARVMESPGWMWTNRSCPPLTALSIAAEMLLGGVVATLFRAASPPPPFTVPLSPDNDTGGGLTTSLVPALPDWSLLGELPSLLALFMDVFVAAVVGQPRSQGGPKLT